MEVVYGEECMDISTGRSWAPCVRDGNGLYRFWGSLKCVVNSEFKPTGININADRYCKTMRKLKARL